MVCTTPEVGLPGVAGHGSFAALRMTLPLSQDLLHKDDVYPGAIQQALLVVDTNHGEATPLVQPHARRVAGKSGQDHLVVANLAGAFLQRAEQLVANPG